MKESTSAFPKTTLYYERKLTHANFPFSTTTNALPRNILHHEGKLTPARFHSSTSTLPTTTLHCEGKIVHATIPFSTSALHHEGKLAHASFPYNTNTSALRKPTLHSEEKLPCYLSMYPEGKHNHKCIASNYITPLRKASMC